MSGTRLANNGSRAQAGWLRRFAHASGRLDWHQVRLSRGLAFPCLAFVLVLVGLVLRPGVVAAQTASCNGTAYARRTDGPLSGGFYVFNGTGPGGLTRVAAVPAGATGITLYFDAVTGGEPYNAVGGYAQWYDSSGTYVTQSIQGYSMGPGTYHWTIQGGPGGYLAFMVIPQNGGVNATTCASWDGVAPPPSSTPTNTATPILSLAVRRYTPVAG